MTVNRRLYLLFLGVLSFFVFVSVLFVPPIPQDVTYHQFADRRAFLGIPNFSDVISNIPFVIVGGSGFLYLVRRIFFGTWNNPDSRKIHIVYLGFFVGVFLTGYGSAYYHLSPTNESLVWDRLPMSMAFMAFLSAMIGERISIRAGFVSFLPLIVLGAASVLYWDMTEQMGKGDLRPYVLVQYYPVILIPLILLLFPSSYPRWGDMWKVFVFYGASKICEVLDKAVYRLGHLVSGHTLKHFFVAIAVYWILRMIQKRDDAIDFTSKKLDREAI